MQLNLIIFVLNYLITVILLLSHLQSILIFIYKEFSDEGAISFQIFISNNFLCAPNLLYSLCY